MATPAVDVQTLPLTERTYAALKAQILSGAIPPGTLLSELRLAQELGTSRTPVREALIRLTHEGFAQRFPGRGVIVLELRLGEILDVFEVQACVEQYAIKRIFELKRPLDVQGLQNIIRLQRDTVAKGDISHFSRLDRELHMRIVEHAGNVKLTQIMQNVSDLCIHGAYRALRSKAIMQDTMAEHEALVAALVRGDLEGAIQASERNAENGKLRLVG